MCARVRKCTPWDAPGGVETNAKGPILPEPTNRLHDLTIPMKNAVFWDVWLFTNRWFGAKYRLQYQGEKNQRARHNVSNNYQLLLVANYC
jgi:hypothetical protein